MSKKRNNVELDADDGKIAVVDDTSNDDGAKDATATHIKKKLKKYKEKDRESSSKKTSEDAHVLMKSSPDAKNSKKEIDFLDALDAIEDNEANDAHSVGSVGNAAMVNQRAMQSIQAVSNMKNEAELTQYLTQVNRAMNSLTIRNSLPVKNLISKFNPQDLKDLR